jgi:site-specific DNA-methyltransferase (adenine-specific)
LRLGFYHHFETLVLAGLAGFLTGGPGRRTVAAMSAREFPPPECPPGAGRLDIHQGDNLPLLEGFPAAAFDLIYIDPPFNTGREQSRTRIRVAADPDGDRAGFQGRRYRTTVLGRSGYADRFDDYLGFLGPRLEQAHRLLAPGGSLFLHLDFREVHYAKVALDAIFGRDSFINEIIWSYDYGARATRRWSPKHDNILWYARDPQAYCFNFEAIDRIPYLAPGLVGPDKAARGKTPTDCWWHTIVSPNGREKTGYPTQKPLAILRRIVAVHSHPGDRLLDFFAGSGSFGEAASALGRDVVLVDSSPEAIAVMRRRFSRFPATFHPPAADPP